jgi:poly(3-hydroxybutyrate) depolymerase
MLRLRRFFAPVAVTTTLVVAAAGMVLHGGLAGTAAASTRAPLASTAGCGRAPGLASGNQTIQSGGQTRSYILRLPPNYDSNHPYRLIFGFHWNGGTANDVDSGGSDGYVWSYYGLRALSDAAGAGSIFVAPQGNGNGWADPNGQDITFVDDMLSLFEANLCIDTTEIFSSGFSYGAGMTYALACARPNVFRAVAVYSGGNLSGCSGGTQPVAYIGLHGEEDSTLPIASGRALRDTFVRNNGCTPQNPPEPAVGSYTHIVTAYSGCKPGYPVVWAAFDSGHTPAPVDGSTNGSGTGAQTWTKQVVWNFFAQFGSNSSPSASPTTSQSSSPSASASASPSSSPTGSAGRIVGTGSGRCVDVPNGSQTSGTQVQLYDCNGNTSQQWTYTSAGELRVYGNDCLDANGKGTTNGTKAIIWSCNGQSNQHWNLNANGTITGAQSGLCLDATGAATSNGTPLELWSCNGGSNQQWKLG